MNDRRKLLGILVLGLFFLVYNFKLSLIWNHDQDLYSWIARDIIVNRHLRLVGQVTSIPGVFIGPFYYYLIALFYWIFRMNPMSAIIPVTAIGLFSIWSLYFVVKEFWGKRAGLISAFLMAVSTGIALFQRWSVPTQPTILWSIWFLYVIFKALEGDKKIIYLYGFLLGMVYHIHIALLPILPLPILAYAVSRGSLKEKFSRIKLKEYLGCIAIFLIFSSPFWLFELKHNWSEVKGMMAATQVDIGAPTGKAKFLKVLNAASQELQIRLVRGWETYRVELIWPVFIIAMIYLLKIKKITAKQTVFIWLWIFLICWAQFVSKRIVSEYYFTNLVILFFIIFSLFISEILSNRTVLGIFLAGYLGLNIFWLNRYTQLNDSYFYKEQAVESIVADAKSKNYPCISVNYIAKFGDGVGFRYLFWNKGMKVVKTHENVPQYDLVIPFAQSDKELTAKFGLIGVIKNKKEVEVNSQVCDDPALTLDPLLGYTE